MNPKWMPEIPFNLVVSPVLDPHWNLAWEDLWLDVAAEASPVCFLWRSRPAVIIGKNQNPWRECQPSLLARRGIALARRISGGGAVYHDEGNLNYAFFMPRTQYEADTVFDWIHHILEGVGVPTVRMNRTGLAVGTRKISGNAFCYRRNAVLHHGTLLVTADLDKLRAALQPVPGLWDTRATASIRAPVMNLVDMWPHLTVDTVQQAFYALGGPAAALHAPTDWLAAETIEQRAETLRADKWQWGVTPPATWTRPTGQQIRIEKGRVVELDPMLPDGPAWQGRLFEEYLQAVVGIEPHVATRIKRV